ncbi:very short patch repair endonuclease [Prosthecobacter vanneervenii]|uniref:DNA mismatch endonuclease (Patch repair protein) n=1 Tax=Prosthecobacter vanneervenii TaxID=48466 RepID=A0A7W7YDJ2_9BACT|nr:very short patch repair endonuclease [Prosthecobacter vanneervenii]MBB5034216.1 DNA mismatch endonuclease (patch repair protein) [Prosthecobacter vanneervenii]
MPDVFTPAKRSEVMSRIRSTGNAATELRLVALMRAAGITGWRRHVQLSLGTTAMSVPPSSSASPAAPGKAKAGGKVKASAPTPATRPLRVRPDFIFRTQRVAVFVDGCFWHGCPRHATRPRQNRKFWDEKIARNRQRDLLVTRRLRQRGWTVLRLWECALTRQRQPRTLARLRRALEK